MCAVVEVALDPPALGALGLRESTTRALDVAEPAGELRAEAGVVQLGGGEPGARTDHLGVGACRVVADPGHDATVPRDVHPVGHVGRRQPRVRDPRVRPGTRIGHRDRRIIERPPEQRREIAAGPLVRELGANQPDGVVPPSVEAPVDEVLDRTPSRCRDGRNGEGTDRGSDRGRGRPALGTARAEPHDQCVGPDQQQGEHDVGRGPGKDPLDVVQVVAGDRQSGRDRDEHDETAGRHHRADRAASARGDERRDDEDGQGHHDEGEPQQLATVVAAGATPAQQERHSGSDQAGGHEQHQAVLDPGGRRLDRRHGPGVLDVLERRFERVRLQKAQQERHRAGTDDDPARARANAGRDKCL